jgi:(E)-4-hydroxy-3-methylbut-2-enyl-diphosphate synthase
MIGKRATIPVHVGGLPLGGEHPIRLQSMTDTDTRDIKATVAQCIRAFESGADLMRISVPDKSSIQALKIINNRLHSNGFHQPLAADIHFKPELAMAAATIVPKIRINPGNFIKPSLKNKASNKEQHLDCLLDVLKPLVKVCNEHSTAIRIGTNAGSLPQHILNTYGHTATAMVQATLEYIAVFEALAFKKLVISLKASDPLLMVESCRLMDGKMKENNIVYPMHVGVTEAGEGLSGRIRSALGIIPLLQDGIGDTIRVSLTEPPEQEISFARKLLDVLKNYRQKKPGSIYPDKDEETIIIKLIADAGSRLLDNDITDLSISTPGVSDKHFAGRLCNELLQAAGKSHKTTAFISCPGCARTSFDIASLVKDLKKELPDLPGLKIAAMGCIVNGPGEMAGADYGLLGTPEGTVHIYHGSKCLLKHVNPELASKRLLNIINTDGIHSKK